MKRLHCYRLPPYNMLKNKKTKKKTVSFSKLYIYHFSFKRKQKGIRVFPNRYVVKKNDSDMLMTNSVLRKSKFYRPSTNNDIPSAKGRKRHK